MTNALKKTGCLLISLLMSSAAWAADPPATFTLDRQTVVTLHANIGGLTPQQRVDRIHRRIDALSTSQLDAPVEPLEVHTDRYHGVALTVSNQILLTLTDNDVDPELGGDLPHLVNATQQTLQHLLHARAESRSTEALLKGVGFGLLATLLFAGAVLLLSRLVRHAEDFVHRQRQRRLPVPGLGIDLSKSLRQAAIRSTHAIAWGTGALLTYVWLAFVLRQFPISRPWGDRLGDILLDALTSAGDKLLDLLPGLFTVLVILLIGRLLHRMLNRLFDSVEQGRLKLQWVYPETAGATRRLSIALLWLLALAAAYPYLPGAQTAAFQGVSVLVGVMITLGSTGLVSQAMSGLVLVYSRAFQRGDLIKVGEVEGFVHDMGALSTKVITQKGVEITVPNAVLTASPIRNLTRLNPGQGSLLSTSVTIGYDTPWRQVHAMLLAAAARTDGISERTPPYVLQKSLSDFYVEYELNVMLAQADGFQRVLSALHGHIQDVFNEYGVQIMSPHFMMQPAERVWVPPGQEAPPPVPHPD